MIIILSILLGILAVYVIFLSIKIDEIKIGHDLHWDAIVRIHGYLENIVERLERLEKENV